MTSICIFGSQARRTADRISDRDVLIVADHADELASRVEEWSSRDWNVSAFDRQAFARMAEVRSLFVQHIKQEGQIVEDAERFLERELAHFKPKADYSGERNDSLHQILQLPMPSGDYWYDLCLADTIYVLLRNAFILHFASQEKYCFHYDELVGLACEEFELLETSDVIGLRRLKHAYRNRSAEHSVGPMLDSARLAVSHIISKVSEPSLSAISCGYTTSDYLAMRLKELRLIAAHDIHWLDTLSSDHELFEIWKRITGASGYPKHKISWH